jgi:eukaryotic-like serine/threonine-protein kinase
VLGGLKPGDPQRIGPYQLVGRLGRGGMGDVFLGLSAGGRPVAVKVIRAALAADPEFRVRFAREVAAVRRVSGLFTALVVDADVDSPVPWLATAYVSGPSLAEAVTGDGPMAARPALALAAGLAEGLSAIHAAGVVHCDLKPSNVLLSPDGPRVIDFGISRAVGAGPAAGVGWVTGSPGFMSPEQALGGEIGPPSDIFSLGAVLTFALTGRGPFGQGSRPELAYRLVYGPPDLGEVPAGLRSLVGRCLAKDPALRPTADEVLAAANDGQPVSGWLPGAALGAIASPGAALGAIASPGASPGSARPAGRSSGRRWWRPLTTAGVTAGLLAASVAVSFALGSPPPRTSAARVAPRAEAAPTSAAAPSAPEVPGTHPASAPSTSPSPGPQPAINPVVAISSPRPSRSPRSSSPPSSAAPSAASPSPSPSVTATASPTGSTPRAASQSPAASPSPATSSPPTTSPPPAASQPTSPGESSDPSPTPEITGTGTYQEGSQIYFDIQYADPGNDAWGFGFKGVNGSRWIDATYPFSSLDQGIAEPGSISYPIDLECGTAGEHAAQVEAWIYDTAGHSSQPVTISLACPS